jgi:mono/diheme cytochrome c family protein
MNWIDRSTRWIGPGAVGILSCVVLLVPACAPDSGSTVVEPQATERGEQVFDDNCGVCHGTGGRGPALAELKALSSAERRDRIRNHPIAGQIPQRLPAHQLSDVIEFLEPE